MTTKISRKERAYYENLAAIMLTTRGSRFTAAQSLSFQERFSIFTTAFLSVFVLGWSIWLIATPDAFTPKEVQILSTISVIATISILVLTLLDYTQGRPLRADRLQQNALRISILVRQLERELCSPDCDVIKLRDIAESYEESVSQTQLNHEPMHFRKWELSRVKPKTRGEKIYHLLTSTIFSAYYYFRPLLVHIGLMSTVVLGLAWFLLLR